MAIILFRFLTCIIAIGGFLYLDIYYQNTLTELQLKIPQEQKALRSLIEESHRLRYEIRQFESPSHLIQLSRRPEFGHLKHPYNREILVIPKPEPWKDG